MPRRLLDLARDGHVTLFTSSVLLDELADVLARDKFKTMLASQGITPAFLMQHDGMLARLVTPQAIERTVRDPDDDAVIATAVAAHAEALVSGDDDLLALKNFQGIPILTAAQVVERIAGEK